MYKNTAKKKSAKLKNVYNNNNVKLQQLGQVTQMRRLATVEVSLWQRLSMR
jgi:hypothetical protein